MSDYILETKGIVKRFGNVTALKNIDLKVKRGEIHVLCGENGAGKSTLMNIISGVYPHGTYEGTFFYNGEECSFKSIRDSEEKNIVIIHQHLALIPPLSIAENIFMGNEQGRRGVIYGTGRFKRTSRYKDQEHRSRKAAACGNLQSNLERCKAFDIG